MASSNTGSAQVVALTRRLADYKETVCRLFPALPSDLVDLWSIKDVDALIMAFLLECYPHEVTVLEVGTFVGVSTFHFASQPKVSRVHGLDLNPLIADHVKEASEILNSEFDHGDLPEIRVLDIARTALAEFAAESEKIRLRPGTVRGAWADHQVDSMDRSGNTEIFAPELTYGEPLLVFLDGARTTRAADEDLKALFEVNPHAIAILDHCRRPWGPLVQGRLAAFMERARGEYRFLLLSDLSPGMATSDLGIVYPDVDSVEVQQSLAELSDLFSERLDPLWLAGREQELIGVVNTYKDEFNDLRKEHEALVAKCQSLADRETAHQRRNSQLQNRNSQLQGRNSQLQERNSQLQERNSQLQERNTQLQERNSQLQERNSQLEKDKVLLSSQLSVFRASRRYRAADAVAENVLRIPGARALRRRNRESE